MTLPNDELVFGYWPARQLRGDIPPAIREPSKYIGGDILNIACTQTSLTKSRQQKLVNEWCNLLPTLQIKTLVFSSKVSQQLFEAACNIPHLEALSIKWSSIVSFEPISKLTCLVIVSWKLARDQKPQATFQMCCFEASIYQQYSRAR